MNLIKDMFDDQQFTDTVNSEREDLFKWIPASRSCGTGMTTRDSQIPMSFLRKCLLCNF